MNYRKSITTFLIVAGSLSLVACVSVPPQSVQLSEAVGKDIEQLYQGYRKTVRTSFAHMRLAGLKIIDDIWTPAYVKDYIKGGNLIQFAKDEKTDSVVYWARGAIEDIDAKRQEFLNDLNGKEEKLLSAIDEAFGRTQRMNATVTAYLGSVQKVKKFQTNVLNDAGLGDISKTLNAGLIEASNFASNLTKEMCNSAAKLGEGAEGSSVICETVGVK